MLLTGLKTEQKLQLEKECAAMDVKNSDLQEITQDLQSRLEQAEKRLGQASGRLLS